MTVFYTPFWYVEVAAGTSQDEAAERLSRMGVDVWKCANQRLKKDGEWTEEAYRLANAVTNTDVTSFGATTKEDVIVRTDAGTAEEIRKKGWTRGWKGKFVSDFEWASKFLDVPLEPPAWWQTNEGFAVATVTTVGIGATITKLLDWW